MAVGEVELYSDQVEGDPSEKDQLIEENNSITLNDYRWNTDLGR